MRSVRGGYRYLRGNSEIDLEPLGGGLVLGAPRLVGGLVDSRVLDAAAAVPLRRVVGRRRDLTGANVARRHAQRTVVRARCTVIIFTNFMVEKNMFTLDRMHC